MTLVAARLGDRGFVSFAKALSRLGVLDRRELFGWLELHGRVICATEPPLDDGCGIGEDVLQALAREFGGLATVSELTPRSEAIALLRRLEETGALSATHLSLASRPELSFEQFQAIGRFLNRVHDGSKWWIADWAIEGEQRFGEEFHQMVAATGRSERTILNWIWTAVHVPPSRRREGLSFSHHVLVAPLEPAEQAQWLDRAEAERLTTRELEAAIRDPRALDSDSRGATDPCDELVEEAARELLERLRACGYDDDIAVAIEIAAPDVTFEVHVGGKFPPEPE